MNKRIYDITERAIAGMDTLYEFRAYTSLSYHILKEDFASGMRVTAILEDAYQKQVDQTYLAKRLEEYASTYLLEVTFLSAVSVLETWIFECLEEILSDTSRLNKKRQIDVGQILGLGNYDDLTKYLVETELNALKYKKVSEWFEQLRTYFQYSSIGGNDIAKFCEVKATRDLLVHNNMVINKTYLEKAGSQSRGTEGDTARIDIKYAVESWILMKKIIVSLGKELQENLNLTKSKTSND